jgi:CRISPR system Cascade subunit CasD
MPAFLTFALVAPLAAFGDVAVGERRGGWDRPGRSAVLGLVAACLGIEREEEERHAALEDTLGLALLCHAPGTLLADYHTAQVPPARRGVRHPTRAAELAAPDLSTVLTRRDYRQGSWHLGTLWERKPDGVSLKAICDAMERPVFVPYLGRKSCPLGLPLAPRIGEAADASSALLARHADGPEARLRFPRGRDWRRQAAPAAQRLVIVMDARDVPPGAPGHLRTETRRDALRSRARWQFDLREEAVLDGGTP